MHMVKISLYLAIEKLETFLHSGNFQSSLQPPPPRNWRENTHINERRPATGDNLLLQQRQHAPPHFQPSIRPLPVTREDSNPLEFWPRDERERISSPISDPLNQPIAFWEEISDLTSPPTPFRRIRQTKNKEGKIWILHNKYVNY